MNTNIIDSTLHSGILRTVIISAFSLFGTTVYSAPTSELYMTGYRVPGGTGNEMAVVQGSQVLRTWGTLGDGHAPAIAVADGTVRTIPVRPGYGLGAEYSLQGVSTGVTYAYPLPSWQDDIAEGTTDGLHNYAGGYFNATVYRFSRQWTEPETLFNVPGIYLGGITYDKITNSLWLLDSKDSGGGSGTVMNYALNGTLLGSFAIVKEAGQQPFGLAFDPADNTLWLGRLNTYAPFDSDVRIQQYALNGSFLGEQSYASLHGLVLSGMESSVPLPASVWLLGSALAAFLTLSKRRSN